MIRSTLHDLQTLEQPTPAGCFAVDRSDARSALDDVDLIDRWVIANGGRIVTDPFARLPGSRNGPSVPRQWYVLPR